MKKISICVVLVLILTVSACFVLVGCQSSDNIAVDNKASIETEKDKTFAANTEHNNESNEQEVYVSTRGVMLEAAPLSTRALALNAVKQGVTKTLQATILPVGSSEQFVDWSIAWKDDATKKNENVTDYVEIYQEEVGSCIIDVTCKKSFGSDKIIITVTTRQGGFKANCTVSFVGYIDGLDIDLSNYTISDGFVQLPKNSTITLPISISNFFNSTQKNLVASVAGNGTFVVDDYRERPQGDGDGIKAGWIGNKRTFNVSSYVSDFVLASVSGDNLVLTTKKTIAEYCGRVESTNMGQAVTTGATTVYYHDKYFSGGGDASFTVTVRDTLSGVSKSFRMKIVLKATSVVVDLNSITF